MKEIKFRQLINGKWHYWGFLGDNNTFTGPASLTENNYQYTGLKDNKRTKKYPKGQEIYEGDNIIFLRRALVGCGYKWGKWKKEGVGTVYWDENQLHYVFNLGNNYVPHLEKGTGNAGYEVIESRTIKRGNK